MADGLFNILMWNVQSGGGARTERIATAIRERKPAPDIILLNEYRVGTSARLVAELREEGWHEFQAGSPPDTRLGGVAVLSKQKLDVRTLPASFGAHAYRCLCLDVPSVDMRLWAVYAPFKEGCGDFWEPLLDELRSDANRDTVLIGDLNAGLATDVPATPRLAGTSYMLQLQDAGYEDLYTSYASKDGSVDYTWRGPTNGYRIDHAFGSRGAASRVRAFGYNHVVREEKVSDHSSLSVSFTPKPLARLGSRRWLQVAVNSHPEILDSQIRDALGCADDVGRIEWLSPREEDRYVEYRDGATIERLGLDISTATQKEFWPSGGPVWDGLARVGDEVLLIEAKAHIPEMLSQGTRATGEARTKILESLRRVRGDLVPKSETDWDGAFYQYANRIAHLHFLRSQGVNAHLVYVYFLNAPDVDSPRTREQWEGATTLVESVLGLRRSRLSRYIHKVFLDVRDLVTPDGIAESGGRSAS
ncbi:MAG: endonuclease/exonuclease/phosphatase family protein [Gemmatimonadota bacterium]|nr:endonuclease/exonuclease/phosphatase family protein [Gemmatimonadota bacterium]